MNVSAVSSVNQNILMKYNDKQKGISDLKERLSRLGQKKKAKPEALNERDKRPQPYKKPHFFVEIPVSSGPGKT